MCNVLQVQHIAKKRDDLKAQYFWMEIMTFYTADELLVVDETAKDLRTIRTDVGWGLRGQTPHVRDEFLTRGGRVSALTLFSHIGFEAWRFTPNTFNTITYQVHCPELESWCTLTDVMFVCQAAMDEMLMQPNTAGNTLASRYACLLLDNASIHKESEFLQRMKSHINVKFIPPYCYHLSPLDFGAYGLVTRFLKANASAYSYESITDQLSRAFRSVCPVQARWCFHQCRYHF